MQICDTQSREAVKDRKMANKKGASACLSHPARAAEPSALVMFLNLMEPPSANRQDQHQRQDLKLPSITVINT